MGREAAGGAGSLPTFPTAVPGRVPCPVCCQAARGPLPGDYTVERAVTRLLLLQVAALVRTRERLLGDVTVPPSGGVSPTAARRPVAPLGHLTVSCNGGKRKMNVKCVRYNAQAMVSGSSLSN